MRDSLPEVFSPRRTDTHAEVSRLAHHVISARLVGNVVAEAGGEVGLVDRDLLLVVDVAQPWDVSRA